MVQGGKQVDCGKLFGTVFCTIFVLWTSAAAVPGQNDPVAGSAITGNGEGSLPSFSETAVGPSPGAGCFGAGFGQPCCCPRWTASADFIILDRVGSFNQTLVETVPHNENPKNPGTEVLNANDFQQGFCGGPRLGLLRHGDDGYDLELSYFQIDGWNDYRSVGPTPDYWLVMRAPGGFLQTQDHRHKQMMAWDYASRLYNAELNVRWNPFARLAVLAGFRWVDLGEDLQGTLPPERAAPFWDNNTRNNLYGFQVGADGKLFERGRFSIDGVLKAGIFDNDAEETTAVSIYRHVHEESASTNRTAFLGEIDLRCKYQVTERLSLKLAYEAIWLQGVALAPGQVQEIHSKVTLPVNVQAFGVNCSSGVFYHGATAGLEYAF